MDRNGTLEFEEIQEYLQTMAFPSLTLSKSEFIDIFKSIDKDNSGSIDKEEMATFLTELMEA